MMWVFLRLPADLETPLRGNNRDDIDDDGGDSFQTPQSGSPEIGTYYGPGGDRSSSLLYCILCFVGASIWLLLPQPLLSCILPALITTNTTTTIIDTTVVIVITIIIVAISTMTSTIIVHHGHLSWQLGITLAELVNSISSS